MYTQQDRKAIKNRIIKYGAVAGVIWAPMIAGYVICLQKRWEIAEMALGCAMFGWICFMWLMFIWPCVRYRFFLNDLFQGIGRELTGSVLEVSEQEEMQDGVRVLPVHFYLDGEQDERILYLNVSKAQDFPKRGAKVTLQCFGRHIKGIAITR